MTLHRLPFFFLCCIRWAEHLFLWVVTFRQYWDVEERTDGGAYVTTLEVLFYAANWLRLLRWMLLRAGLSEVGGTLFAVASCLNHWKRDSIIE